MPRPAVLYCAGDLLSVDRPALCRGNESHRVDTHSLLPDVLVLNLNPVCYYSIHRRTVEESHIGHRSTQEHEGGREDGRFSGTRDEFYAKCRCFSKLPNLTCFIKLASYRPLKAISFLVYRGSLDDYDLKRCFHYDQSIRFIQTDMDFPLATTLQHRTLFYV